MKSQSNDVFALSSTSPTNQPLSSELLIRQALHGPLPLDGAFTRPKEGNDTCMFDLSGTSEDHLKFLPGLEASRYAPKDGPPPSIAIDPQTGAAVLTTDRGIPCKSKLTKYSNVAQLDGFTEIEMGGSRGDGVNGMTYADIMSEQKLNELYQSDDEMDWEEL
jgi:hypothetical protein